MPTTARQRRVPSANSPQVLSRLLELVARGIRTNRGLEEALGLDARTVKYYLQAGAWLGLLDADGEAVLTATGLEYVYAGPEREAIYARAVWANPFVQRLMAGRQDVPDEDEVIDAIAAAEPALAPGTVRRRASAVRALLAPALHSGPGAPMVEQLDLPFGGAPDTAPPRAVVATSRDYSPDIYRFVLGCMLDYGELSLGHLRALLDQAGAHEAPIGGYIEMALSRGDAVRMSERIVASVAAVVRRDLVDSTASVMLSDPHYRAYLSDVTGADRQAEVRASKQEERFRLWNQRLLGKKLAPDDLGRDLAGIVLDRGIGSFPMALGPGASLTPLSTAFLDGWDQPGLAIALPPSLNTLRAGLPGVNRVLRSARQLGGDVGVPGLGYRPVLYHGGLIYPGEPLPRSVPDNRTLRQRLLMNAPYPALFAALLLVHRRRPERLGIIEHSGRWSVTLGPHEVGGVLALLDAFATDQGWVACRRPLGGLSSGVLLEGLEVLGIVTVVGHRAVLAERFFTQLIREAEEMELYARLEPLAQALDEYLARAWPS